MRPCLIAVFVLVLLAACRPSVRADLPDQVDVAARQQSVHQLKHWRLQGRVAISDGRDGGSGRLDWLQHDDVYEFSFRAPVSGRTWRLSGDDRGALLEGVAEQSLWHPEVAVLLERELGWPVPVDTLAYWVRGLSAPDAGGLLERDERGLPLRMEQRGWRIAYQDWSLVEGIALPRRMSAERADFRLRVVVDTWTLFDAETPDEGG